MSVVVDGVGLNVTVLSHRDDVNVGIVADRDQIGDVRGLMAGIERALDELEGAVVV